MSNSSARSPNYLLVVGTGPGIGRSTTTVLVENRYDKVVLFARRGHQLKEDQAHLEGFARSSGIPNLKVFTFPVDVTDTEQLLSALDQIPADFGLPECIFYNAAQVRPSEILKFPLDEIMYDFKVTNQALYVVAQWALPRLTELVDSDQTSRPSILVTGSLLHQDPIPQVFALSMTKAAQRNFVLSLANTYGSTGIHIGIVAVGGQVNSTANLRPSHIATKMWEWFDQPKDKQIFELVVEA